MHVSMETKKLGKLLELTEVETLSKDAIDEIRKLEATASAITQSWYRLREEEEVGKDDGCV